MESAFNGFKTAFATHVRTVEKTNMTKPGGTLPSTRLDIRREDKVDLVGFIVRGILKSIGNDAYDDMQLVRKLLHSHNKEDSDLGAAVQKMTSLLSAEDVKNKANQSELAKLAEFEQSPNKKDNKQEESTKGQETTS